MRRAVVLAAAAVLALAPGATAQEADEELAGYVGTAIGAAFSLQPVFPGLLPTGDAPVEVTGALSAANVKSGGNAFGQAAAVWPGSAAANLGPLLGTAAGQPMFTELVPPYPVVVQANQDDGEQVQGAAPGPVMRASGDAGGAEATSSAAGALIPGVLQIDAVSSTSRSLVDAGTLVTETVVTLSGVQLVGGVVTIDSLRSTAKAVSDGTTSESTGSTVVAGLQVAGQAAELTEQGLRAQGVPVEVLTAALAAAGIELELTKGSGAAEGGAADRVSSGLLVTMANPVAAANPQFSGSEFILSLAPTAVGALASPPFDLEDFAEFPVAALGDGGGAGFTDLAGSVTDTFTSPPAATGAPAAGAGSLALEPVRRSLPSVGGVSFGMVAAVIAAAVFGAHRLSRYVARFLTIEEH